MNDGLSYIDENIKRLRQRIAESAHSCGRNPEDIALIGVTKTIDIPRMIRMTECGIRSLGENRVQEMLGKYDCFQGCDWHLIGSLQKNKVKYLPGKVRLIHSVDSIELVRELDRRAISADCRFEILIELNCAGEASKSGIPPERTAEFIDEVSTFGNVRIQGLMTIAPYIGDQRKIGLLFENIYKIFIDMKKKNKDNINIECLSMGMSNDFETAIKEGSNMIRIGTAIFGPR